MKVAIIIPTMNRPEFLLRQFEFYEQMKSPHPVYISDSSNTENAEKIKNGIKKFKNFKITYQWAPPGKDCLYQLLPLVEEKYCIQMGDDDIIIPKTISDCGEFLESNSDYGTCAGRQVNIRLRAEDYDKPWGMVGRQTLPLGGKSIEDEDILVRTKKFWSDSFFICFVVRRIETERALRNITKHFYLAGHLTEFILISALIISGKFKVLDQLGYIMQVSNIRYDHLDQGMGINLITSPTFSQEWKICEEGLAKFICDKGISPKESLFTARQLLILDIAHWFGITAKELPIGQKPDDVSKRKARSKLRHFASKMPFLKNIYYRYNPPNDVTKPESKYYNDFKVVKDFLENQQ